MKTEEFQALVAANFSIEEIAQVFSMIHYKGQDKKEAMEKTLEILNQSNNFKEESMPPLRIKIKRRKNGAGS
jgi:predicted metal-dependent TIM-barrel fold hydrolase